MTYVIAEPCIGTKDTACVDACPVDCIHPKKDEPAYATEQLLYIDPVECIDCGACVPVCPVSAIFALDDLPEKWNCFHRAERQVFRAVGSFWLLAFSSWLESVFGSEARVLARARAFLLLRRARIAEFYFFLLSAFPRISASLPVWVFTASRMCR